MKKSAKNVAVLLAVLAVAMTAFGCASTNRWVINRAAQKYVKTETVSQSDELAANELPKELSVDVVKSSDADPSLSDATLEKMKGNVVEQFADDGWAIREGTPLKLHVVMSLCNHNEIAGNAMFEKEGKTIATFSLILVRSKKIMNMTMSIDTTYATENQLRMIFAQGIVQAINDQAKNVQQK